ncbi:unnamed protein product, partial [Iphiclides podalirius]
MLGPSQCRCLGITPMDENIAEPSGETSSEERSAGVRLVVLNLPEDEGDGLGFRLTRTLWDPYPWVREVTPGARADLAGLKTGDCLLQVDGRDLLGMPVGQVAGLIRGDGTGGGVSLLVWNCGVDPKDDPELLWSCGGGSRGEKSRRALAGVIKALSCCVCAATATKALTCARSHLYCEACWSRLERCALCRENLPSKESPYSRNLVAEQHKLVAKLRQACSLADLQNTATSACTLSKSLNNISIGNQCCSSGSNSNSLDNVRSNYVPACDPPVYVLAAPPPIYKWDWRMPVMPREQKVASKQQQDEVIQPVDINHFWHDSTSCKKHRRNKHAAHEEQLRAIREERGAWT